MKTAVDKVGPGKERAINARFHTMCGHYLFEPEFCNWAAGWEKGIVEKNVQDRRRQIWHEAIRQRWESLDVLNIWLGERCKAAWQELRAIPSGPSRPSPTCCKRNDRNSWQIRNRLMAISSSQIVFRLPA